MCRYDAGLWTHYSVTVLNKLGLYDVVILSALHFLDTRVIIVLL